MGVSPMSDDLRHGRDAHATSRRQSESNQKLEIKNQKSPMAITALNSAATGLRALSTRIDVIANNLANAETTAFKRSRMNFEDLMYLTLREPGANNNNNEPSPAGTFVGLGVKISNTQLDTEQ